MPKVKHVKEINPGRVLYKDEHLLVVNKLAGELVVAAGGKGKQPLFDFLKKTNPGLRVVHRLDFGTSGVIVFALTADAVARIRERNFKGWKKTYHALVAGHIERRQGTIEYKLKARTNDMLVDAVSHYRVLEAFQHATYVAVDIDTGRKHQIRQHMKHIGHPLLLDPLYGDEKKDRAFKKNFHYSRFFLHAYSLEFPHPITGQIIKVSADVPAAFESVLGKLRERR